MPTVTFGPAGAAISSFSRFFANTSIAASSASRFSCCRTVDSVADINSLAKQSSAAASKSWKNSNSRLVTSRRFKSETSRSPSKLKPTRKIPSLLPRNIANTRWPGIRDTDSSRSKYCSNLSAPSAVFLPRLTFEATRPNFIALSSIHVRVSTSSDHCSATMSNPPAKTASASGKSLAASM